MRRRLLGILVLVGAVGCRARSSVEIPVDTPDLEAAFEPLLPIPMGTPVINQALAEVGRRLFADKSLSGDGSVACASCHRPDRAGADSVPLSIGASGRKTTFNAPPLYNVVYASMLGWTGTESSLDHQIVLELTSPDRMDSRRETLARIMAAEPELARMELDPAEALACALAQHIRTLVTPGSNFDRYLRGDKEAMSWLAGELGYVEFKSFGCAACHQGVLAGGNLLAKSELAQELADQVEDAPLPDPADRRPEMGRWLTTRILDDQHVFRVPSLRNIDRTGPYFHDGSVATLEEAIQREATRQAGHAINQEQVAEIAKFLCQMDGPVPQGERP